MLFYDLYFLADERLLAASVAVHGEQGDCKQEATSLHELTPLELS